jgi:alpha-ketoglutarate-dependent taurine dioxygenase
MLAANQVPELGGETGFADMRATFESLDAETQAELEPLSAYRSLHFSQVVTTLWLGLDTQWTHGVNPAFYGYRSEAYLRPLVKTHPKTGRKNIFIGRHTYGIMGPDGPLDPMKGVGGVVRVE